MPARPIARPARGAAHPAGLSPFTSHPRPLMATGTSTSVKQFATGLMPDWEFPRDWFAWPPDVFALTAAVFARTGCYRQVVTGAFSRGTEWQLTAEKAGVRWAECVSERLAGRGHRVRKAGEKPGKGDLAEPELLGSLTAELERLADRVTMEQLRVLQDADAECLSMVLLKLHAISDEACTGLGFPGFVPEGAALAHCLGNLLLASKGSLSSLPKHCGIVLPKMRTPQKGLTLRSLALHLTFHETEVEVMWRAMPWPNFEENTLNLLAVPWPCTVQSTFFHPQPDTLESIRYFKFQPHDRAPRLPAERIVDLIRDQEIEHGCRVHVVALPESALSEGEYRDLLAMLRAARLSERISWVPLVIGGIRQTRTEARPEGAREEELNQVRLAAYFAGRWYTLSQRKHHRWKLDRNQVRQYGLDGHLATRRDWYEGIALGQRRLTFLAPTGWLTLCPLICEDLAQLEPVSELIRGVGPTLLVALLADGPQLETRWSARYASVFADDPGTAVLTLTSLGMATRSRRVDEPPPPPGRDSEAPSSGATIALWRDLARGWRKVELGQGFRDGDPPAVLLTVSADWQKEYTADGRHDHEFAATFKLEGVRPVVLAPRGEGCAVGRAETELDPASAQDAKDTASDRRNPVWGEWADIRELSAAIFALDTVVSLSQRRSEDIDIVLAWLLGKGEPAEKTPDEPRLSALVEQVMSAQNNPELFGISWRRTEGVEYEWSRDLTRAADVVIELLGKRQGVEADYLESLYDVAVADLAELRRRWDPRHGWSDEHRMRLAVGLAVLASIYNNLEGWKRPRTLAHGEHLDRTPPLPTERAAALLKRVESALATYTC